MYPYDSQYRPPAPVLPIQISRPLGVSSVTVQGFLDSGADITILPNMVVRDLNLQPVSIALSRGFGGPVSESTVFAASVSLIREESKATRVLGWDEVPLGNAKLRKDPRGT